MSKLYSLFGGKTIDTEVQVVEVNQVIQMKGYSYHRYVVCDIIRNKFGITYKLINLTTKEFSTAEIIQPLKDKFGIGFYYDSDNPEFMDAFEVAVLLSEVQEKTDNRIKKEREEKKQREAVQLIGRQWLQNNLPEDAQAIVIACQRQDKYDIQANHHEAKTTRTVILGFSKHKRNVFSEMRIYATNFEETAYLAEKNEDYEHIEKHSLGKRYYLGESYYSGWIIRKAYIYNREDTIQEFSFVAGNSDNIQLGNESAKETTKKETITIVYSHQTSPLVPMQSNPL